MDKDEVYLRDVIAARHVGVSSTKSHQLLCDGASIWPYNASRDPFDLPRGLPLLDFFFRKIERILRLHFHMPSK